MIRYSTSIKTAWLLALLVMAAVAVQGCGSSDPPKNGVKIQAGDYDHAPGEGKAPPK